MRNELYGYPGSCQRHIVLSQGKGLVVVMTPEELSPILVTELRAFFHDKVTHGKIIGSDLLREIVKVEIALDLELDRVSSVIELALETAGMSFTIEAKEDGRTKWYLVD